MTTAVEFVQAMRDAPDDEALRLVFADWLEDRGDPRGEFLRVQVELARWVPDLARRTALRQRERELLAGHGREWIGPLADYCLSWHFEGGLAHVTMNARRFAGKAFAARAEELLTRAWVRRLRLEGAYRHRRAVAAAPYLALVPELDLGGLSLRDAPVYFLVDCPHLDRLTRLDLSNNLLSDHALLALLEAPWLARLTELDLHNNALTDASVRRLLNVRPRLRLRRLDVQGNALFLPTRRQLSAWHERQPARDPARVVNALGMEFVRIPAGTFLMGSSDTEAYRYDDEGPLHELTLRKPFFLSVYPVTQQCYREVMGTNPSHFDAGRGGGPPHPVDSVTWENAAEFCRCLSDDSVERAAGRAYRLPTEAEWEHACRAGTTTPFWWGDTATSLWANFDGQHPYGGADEGPALGRTSPVGSYPANPFGLYDMNGNVWEWCADWYGKHYYATSPPVDPPGPDDGEFHVLRGGCWQHLGACARAAYRLDHPPGGTYQGFRVTLR
jgi:uncharacterized protein (TIGR02996 family)